MASSYLTAKQSWGAWICVHQHGKPNSGMGTFRMKCLWCGPAVSAWRHFSLHTATSHALFGFFKKKVISGWRCVRFSRNGTVRLKRTGYSELPLWPSWRKWLLRRSLCGPTSVSQEVLVDFALGIFHDLHHALRHFLYEALGREERASKSGKLPAGPLHPSYWQRKEPLKPLGAAIWQSVRDLRH